MRGRIMLALLAVFAAASLCLVGTPTQAAQNNLQTLQFKALMHDSGTPHVDQLERPFWTKWLPEASGGKITADANTIDQVGISDDAVLRLLKLGAFDFASFDIGKLGGDDPRFEGCDLSGLTFDFKSARAACNAWRPIMARIMEKQWNAKLLAITPAPPQAIWCNPKITGIADLKGKKIRVYTRTMIDFAKGVGAIPINLNFHEVVTGLQNHVVDCAVTGTLVGNLAGWTEVTHYLMPIRLGWAMNVHVVNLNTWKRINPTTQAFLLKQFKKFENRFWTTMEADANDAKNCNVGKEPCKFGKLAHMTMVHLTPEELTKFKGMMQHSVLSAWAKRAGPNAVKEWNATVGKVLDMTAAP